MAQFYDYRKNDYADYWSDKARRQRIFIYEMLQGLPSHYSFAPNRKAIVQKEIDGTWRGYVNGVLIACGEKGEINRVMIRTYKKYQKSVGQKKECGK